MKKILGNYVLKTLILIVLVMSINGCGGDSTTSQAQEENNTSGEISDDMDASSTSATSDANNDATDSEAVSLDTADSEPSEDEDLGNTEETSGSISNESRIIVDMADRSIEIPGEIGSIFGVNNNSSIFLYALAPEMMVGWNTKMKDSSKLYLDPAVADLPNLGTLYGNSDDVNLEAIIGADPDLLLLVQSPINEKVIEKADALTDQIGIPVVILDGNIDTYASAYKVLGDLIGKEEEALALSDYCEATYDLAAEVKDLYGDTGLRVYYGRGEDGLSTEIAGSTQSYLFEMLGAENVITSDMTSGNNAMINLEVLIENDPDAIILGSSGFAVRSVAADLLATDGWNILSAVNQEKVYMAPQLPFNWVDRPPSSNRILGIHWLISVLYPEYEKEDIEQEVKTYFDLFYHVTLNEDQVSSLLGL